jgi:glycine/D-amino acid oxidase-like deaminating enzyme
VCIVGGGHAGLWTAVELASRQPGMRIALLERDICGGGASGRSGGLFTSSWWDLPAIVGLFGRDEGVRYARVLADSIGETEKFAAQHDIDCWLHRDGTLGVRTGEWQEGPGHPAIGLLHELGLGERMRAVDAAQARALADSPRFLGGTITEDGATVQPARLAFGLRKVALGLGVRIYEGTPVVAVDRTRPAVIRTDRGAVKADHVVLTIGAWAAGWREFARSFGVIVDHCVVTEPIPERLERIGWRTHVGIADGRELLYYLRRTDDHRIVIGGGSTGVVWGGRLDSGSANDRRLAEVAARGLVWLFPQLEGVRFTHAWGGPIDMTPTFLPFFRTLPSGNVHAGLGFSGHGLAQTMVGGKILASLVQGVEDEWSTLPVVGPEVSKAPPEPVRYPLVRAAAAALERGDAREEAGERRGLLADLIGSGPSRHRERLIRRLGASSGRRASS